VPARLVVLASGEGSLLQALLDACADPRYGAEVVAVGADRPDIRALDRAARAGLPVFVHRVGDFPDRVAWDHALTESVRAHSPDLVISAGFMKLVGKEFLDAFPHRYLNTHPALLPSFPGMYGVRDALDYGVKMTGCTVIIADEGVDSGPILAQASVPVLDGDTEETLHERIKSVERSLLVETVGRMVRDGWTVDGRKVTIP
jgi:phosphoribosylglycinamide formyltransferase 1